MSNLDILAILSGNPLEKEIETFFCSCIRRPYVTVEKEKLGPGCTDGIIRKYNKDGKLIGWGINETKRDVGLSSVWYRRAWLQTFMYLGNVWYDIKYGDLSADNFMGIILNSKRYFAIIPKSEVDKIMCDFEPLWDKYNRVLPSVAYHVPDLYDWVKSLDVEVKEYPFTHSFILDDIINDYLNMICN